MIECLKGGMKKKKKVSIGTLSCSPTIRAEWIRFYVFNLTPKKKKCFKAVKIDLKIFFFSSFPLIALLLLDQRTQLP